MHTRSRTRGFTLIEILVVVSILAVLMGLVSILVIRGPEEAKKMETQTLVKAHIPAAVDRYNGEFKKYPPCTTEALAKSSERYKGLALDNDVNLACEVLVAALRHPDFSAPLGDSVEFGNTDNDFWNEAPPNMKTDAEEIVDGWGNPIVYIPKSEYGKTMRIQVGEEIVDVVALKKADGTYYNPTSYQIISVGPDGKQDEDLYGDDIRNFDLETSEG